ncbi:MAG: OpgC domain-containing protein [Gammaproteobacteria bacterium]
MAAAARPHTAALLAASWLIYALHTLHPVRLLALQSELAFPVLTWQLLFVHGMAAGYHRRALAQRLGGQAGRRLMVAGAVALAVFSFYALNNPWFEIPFGLRFDLIPEHCFGWVYYYFFDRKSLGIGRVANTFLLVAVLYLLLTRYWEACRRAAGCGCAFRSAKPPFTSSSSMGRSCCWSTTCRRCSAVPSCSIRLRTRW